MILIVFASVFFFCNWNFHDVAAKAKKDIKAESRQKVESQSLYQSHCCVALKRGLLKKIFRLALAPCTHPSTEALS